MKISVYSPLRISFAGGGTDISPFFEKYGGAVFNTTIDRGILLRYTDDKMPLEVSSRDFLKSAIVLKQNSSVEDKIMELFMSNGIKTGKLIINSDVPPGSGLGSSSALITGILKIIYKITNKNKNSYEIAEEAYNIEKTNFGIVLGKQDPYAISVGGLKYMEFSKNSVITEAFNLENDFIETLQKSMLLVYTGKTRESSNALRDQVIKSEKNDSDTLNKLLKIKGLAGSMEKAFKTSDYGEFCNIVNSGWEIKKTLGEKVSSEKVDGIIDFAKSIGARAARLLGGGLEGFILLITPPDNVNNLQKEMLKKSEFVIRVRFDPMGSRLVSPF